MSRYSIHLDQNNSAIFIFVHLLLSTCLCFSSLLLLDTPAPPPLECVPASLCKFAPDNSGRTVPTSGVVAAAVAETACYPAGVMAAWLPLLPPFLPLLLCPPCSPSLSFIFLPLTRSNSVLLCPSRSLSQAVIHCFCTLISVFPSLYFIARLPLFLSPRYPSPSTPSLQQ